MTEGLENLDDIKLINNIKTDLCNDSLNVLMEKHMPLCNQIYRRYAPQINKSGARFDDVYEDRFRIFWNSVFTFEPDKNTKFSTWLGHMVRFQCLNAINKNGKYVALDPEIILNIVEKPVEQNLYHEYLFKNENHCQKNNPNETKELREYIFDIVSQMKDERIKKIFELRLEDFDLTWREIASIIGTTQAMAISLFEKGKKILKEKLNSETLFDNI